MAKVYVLWEYGTGRYCGDDWESQEMLGIYRDPMDAVNAANAYQFEETDGFTRTEVDDYSLDIYPECDYVRAERFSDCDDIMDDYYEYVIRVEETDLL